MGGSLPIGSLQIGRQFRMFEDSTAIDQQTQVSGLKDMVKAGVDKVTGKSAKQLKTPDESFVNYLRAGGMEKFGSAIMRAEQLALGCTTNEAEEEIGAKRTAQDFGISDLDAFADRLAQKAVEKFTAAYEDRSFTQIRDLAKTALVKLFSMPETETQVKGGRLAAANETEWKQMYAVREKDLMNSALGIMELLRDGGVSPNAILYLKDDQVFRASNLDDLLELTSRAAESAKKAFIGKERFGEILSLIDQRIEDCKADKTGSGICYKIYGKQLEDLREKIAIDFGSLMEARDRAVEKMVTGYSPIDLKGKPLSGKAKKAALDRIRSSNRSFRFSMDSHLGHVSPSKATRIRRWFDNLFGSKTGAVSKKDYKACVNIENDLMGHLGDLDSLLQLANQPAGMQKLFDDLDTVTHTATDLTHTANDIVRNYKNKVYPAFANHAEAMNEIFGESLRAKKNETWGVTCTLGVGVEADFGLAKISAGADRRRDIVVTLLDSGAVQMTVLKGAAGNLGLKAGVPYGTIDANVVASRQKGETHTWKTFDAFVNDSFGKLIFPKLSGIKGKQQSRTVYSGHTGGSPWSRLMRSAGALSFGTRVDTLAFANKIRQQGIYGQVTNIVGTHAPMTSADTRTFKKTSVEFTADAQIGTESDGSDTGGKALGLGVKATRERESGGVNRTTIDFFESVGMLSEEERRASFALQLDRAIRIGKNSDHPFAQHFQAVNDFKATLEAVVAEPAEGSTELLSPAEASLRLLNLMQKLAAAADAQAPLTPPEAVDRHWRDYASMLRACTLAQSILQMQVSFASDVEKLNFSRADAQIRRISRGLVEKMPKDIYENAILSGSFGLKDLPVDRKIDGLSFKYGDSTLRGQVVSESYRAEDKNRPWLKGKRVTVEFDIPKGTSLDSIADFLMRALVRNSGNADPNVGFGESIVSRKNRILKEMKEDRRLSDIDRSSRYSFEFVDGELMAFTSKSVSSATVSKQHGSGNAKIVNEKKFFSVKERFSVLKNPSLDKMLYETEKRLAGELGERGNEMLSTFMNQNANVLGTFIDGFIDASKALDGKEDMQSTPARKIMSTIFSALPRLYQHSRLCGLANNYFVRLAGLQQATKDKPQLTPADRVRLGSEYLVLSVQLLRLISMAEEGPEGNRAEVLLV